MGSNFGSTTLSVLLGQGDGTFVPGSELVTGDGPALLATGDFNNDGFPDLASANHEGHTVSVILSNGSNGFTPPQSYNVGAGPVSLDAGDADGDGHLDLLVANQGSNDLSLLLGRGDGSFDGEVRLEGYSVPNQAVFRDVNGDARIDIVSAQLGSGAIFFSLGQGGGTFQQPGAQVSVGTQPRSVRSGDVDDDGFLDLISVNFASDDVSLARGLGDGSFAPAQSVPVPSPVDLLLGDFTGDEVLDLAVSGTGVALLVGKGDGAFVAPSLLIGGKVERAESGDFNDDGHLDLALVTGSTQVTVLLGRGDGSFQEPVATDAGTACNRLTVSDFDGDGDLDLATLNIAARVAVLLGKGDGSFQPLPSLHVPGPEGDSSLVIFLASADLNQDGHSDLVVTHSASGNLSMLWGNGDGTFQPRVLTKVGGGVAEVLIADMNGDGTPDLTCTFANLILPIIPGLAVLTGEGDGTFRRPLYFLAGYSGSSVATGDFNLDGAADLVGCEVARGALTVLLAR